MAETQTTTSARKPAETRRFGSRPSLYRLVPDLAFEMFDNQAIIFLAGRDLLLTVNRAAAVILELVQNRFAEEHFTSTELAAQLEGQYHLSRAESLAEARKIIAFSIKHGIINRLSKV